MTAQAQLNTGNAGWGQFDLTPSVSLCVFGMRRAGNHAIINWLLRNPPANSTGTIFMNNCGLRRSPFDSHKSLEVNGKRRGRTIKYLPKAGAAPMVVISYEDRPPPDPEDNKTIPPGFDISQIDHNIIVFRSFLNWSASLLKKLRINSDYTAVSRGRIMLSSIERYGQMLARLQSPGFVGICYDPWVISQGYRADVLKQLGLPVSDNTLGDMQRYGGGSSFPDKVLPDQDMESHKRWVHMVEDSEYLALLWIAAQDAGLLKALGELFPVDLEMLQPLVGVRPGLGAAP